MLKTSLAIIAIAAALLAGADTASAHSPYVYTYAAPVYQPAVAIQPVATYSYQPAYHYSARPVYQTAPVYRPAPVYRATRAAVRVGIGAATPFRPYRVARPGIFIGF